MPCTQLTFVELIMAVNGCLKCYGKIRTPEEEASLILECSKAKEKVIYKYLGKLLFAFLMSII